MSLDSLNCSIIPFFSLNGIKTNCRLVDVYDGDTITCIIPIFSSYYKFQLRLNGIDTPELKSKNESIKHQAFNAKNRIIELTTGKNDITNLKEYLENNPVILWIHCYKFDKYGRVLSDIFLNDQNTISLSNILLKEHLALPYDGKSKLSFDNF